MNEDAHEAIDAMIGRTIVDGELTDEGLHLSMDDGRIIIVMGILAITEPEGKVLQ